MKNMYNYIKVFLDELEVWEDENNGEDYKKKLSDSIYSFLTNANAVNGVKVYSSFFDSYWIGIQECNNPFLELLEKMKLFEEGAEGLVKKQRDHFIHSVYVFLLGISIYSRNSSFQRIFNEVVLNKSLYPDSYNTKHEEFLYRWGIAALFHDIAYPIEITINQINEYLGFIASYTSQPTNALKLKVNFLNIDKFESLNVLETNAKYEKEYKNKYIGLEEINLKSSIDLMAAKISDCFDIDKSELINGLKHFISGDESNTLDHGFYSSLIIMKWYNFLIDKTQWNPAYFYFPIVDSASAILLHNYYKYGLMEEPYRLKKMNSRSHPIAFLLIMCDELQDWGRKGYGINDLNGNKPLGFDLNIENEQLKLTYIFDHETEDLSSYIIDKKRKIDDILEVDEIFSNGFKLMSKIENI